MSTINWIAVRCEYDYINRDPDPTVHPSVMDWVCEAIDDTDPEIVGKSYGRDALAPDLPQFAESDIKRVTGEIMLTWLHDSMSEVRKAGKEGMAQDALDKILLPARGSTPPYVED